MGRNALCRRRMRQGRTRRERRTACTRPLAGALCTRHSWPGRGTEERPPPCPVPPRAWPGSGGAAGGRRRRWRRGRQRSGRTRSGWQWGAGRPCPSQRYRDNPFRTASYNALPHCKNKNKNKNATALHPSVPLHERGSPPVAPFASSAWTPRSVSRHPLADEHPIGNPAYRFLPSLHGAAPPGSRPARASVQRINGGLYGSKALCLDST